MPTVGYVVASDVSVCVSSTPRRVVTGVLRVSVALQLKSVRLPRKFDGTNRGFAFVEFASRQEAKSAVAALSSSHLYGRHIVLEWAEDKEDLDTLRAKAGRDIKMQRLQ